jgi:hypothetical protein
MKPIILFCVVISAMLHTSHATAADTLKDKLKEAGWDGLLGTWVDEATGGKGYTSNYAWKIQDRVIEVRTRDATNETVALMGVNAKNGQVFHMGADKQGASSLGEWKVDADGSAVLNLVFTGGDGAQGTLQMRHKLIGKDKMEITVQLAQPLRFTLVRKK